MTPCDLRCPSRLIFNPLSSKCGVFHKIRFTITLIIFINIGVFFIVLNSQYYKDGTLVEDIKKDHDLWLDKQLKLAKTAKHTVVFQHIPLFLLSVDEEDGYFTLCKKDRDEIVGKLKDAGVKYVFAGHYHRNAGGFDGDLEMVVTSAIGFPIGEDKHGMRVVTVKEDKIVHSFEDLYNFPKSVELK